MRYWLLRRPFDKSQPFTPPTVEELRGLPLDGVGGDEHIALLEGPIDGVDWIAESFFILRDREITDLSAQRRLSDQAQEQSTINALWMSMLARDRAAIRALVSSDRSQHGLAEISRHCWERLFRNQEFPLGNALRLLMQHFYESYKDAFGDMPRNANSGRITQWVAAADFLFIDIQQRFIEPAYWGRAVQNQWFELRTVLQDAPPLEQQIFRASKAFPAADGPNTQTPNAKATRPYADSDGHADFHIPFGDLTKIADAWDPELLVDGKVRSRALDSLKSDTRFFLECDTNELPPFPGGLNDEI
jgi:hypothetical protein